jgi:hypothetical protein
MTDEEVERALGLLRTGKNHPSCEPIRILADSGYLCFAWEPDIYRVMRDHLMPLALHAYRFSNMFMRYDGYIYLPDHPRFDTYSLPDVNGGWTYVRPPWYGFDCMHGFNFHTTDEADLAFVVDELARVIAELEGDDG